MQRSLPFRQAILTVVCIVAVTGCSNPQAGTDPSQDAAATSDRASANPPPVLVTQRSLPAASTSFPTGHPSLRPSTADNPPVATSARASSAKRSANGASNGLEDALPGAGAAAPASVPVPADAAIKNDAGSTFDNLELVDASLKGKLAVLRVGSDPSTNNLLAVFAGLKNRTAKPLALEVQTIYKDKSGAALNAGSWVPLTLKPHEETEYRSSSISTDADDFLVRVRRAQTEGGSGGN